MVCLIEGKLQKDRRAIECDIRERRARKIDDAYRPHAKVGVDAILRGTVANDGGRDLVQKRVVERPTVRVRQRHVDVNAGSTTRDSPAHRRLPDAIRER